LDIFGARCLFRSYYSLQPKLKISEVLGFEKGPFTIDSPPPVGGRLDYYPFWEISFDDKYPVKGNGSSMNEHYPIWSDRIGFGGVVSDCSRDGQYAVAGSDLGLIRLYDREGNILWTYQEPGKPVGNVRISPDGKLIFAAFFNPDPNPKQNVGRIIRFDHNGTVLWKFDSDQPLRGESGSEDGDYEYILWGNFLSILDNQGRVKNWMNISEPAGFLKASGNGNLCVVASHLDTFGKFFIINVTGNTLSTS
jgi:WD40 repeat protein